MESAKLIELLSQFRDGQLAFQNCFSFLLATPAGTESPSGAKRFGHVTLPCSNEQTWLFKLSIVEDFIDSEWFISFERLSTNAGLYLPLPIKDSLQWTAPSTPYAWWFAAMWCFGAAQRRSLSKLIDTSFISPFELSARAMQRILELTETDPETAEDEANSQSKKIKATPATLIIIRLIQDGKSNDEILAQTRSSASNVRKIRSLYMNGKYDIA